MHATERGDDVKAFAVNTNELRRVHAGQNPLGESHFSIFIVSPVFAGESVVTRHREIYRVLADELHERVHALSLQALSLEEHAKRSSKNRSNAYIH
jgi:BolA protein